MALIVAICWLGSTDASFVTVDDIAATSKLRSPLQIVYGNGDKDLR